MKKILIGEKQSCDYRKTCYGIVLKGDELLVVYSEKEYDYSLVGGGIEPNETPDKALNREFLEESGYLITDIQEFVNIDCFWVKRDGRYMETDALFYLVKVDETNNKKPTEPFHKPMWIKLVNAQNLIQYPYQKEALKLFLSKLHNIDFFQN